MTGAEIFPEGAPSSATVARALAEMSIIGAACELIPEMHKSATLTIGESIDELEVPGSWRGGQQYQTAMANQLDTLIIGDPTTQSAIKHALYRVEHISDTMAQVERDPDMLPGRYVGEIATYDAVERVGWLRQGVIAPGVRAAYRHILAGDIYARNDEVETYPDRKVVAETNRALRIYLHHVQRGFRFAPYVELVNLMYEDKPELELNGRHDSLIGHWWTQLSEDLRKFRNATV